MSFNAFDLAKLYRQVSSVRRYSTIHLCKDENIAEHSMHVAMLCEIVGSKVIDKLKAEGNYHCENIDLGRCIKLAIFHDLDEIITGDIPRATKYHSESMHEAASKLAENAQNQISRIFGISCRLMDYKSSASKDSIALIKACDFLSVVLKIYWELELGNLDARDMIPEISKYALELSESNKVAKIIYDDFMSPILSKISDFNFIETLNFRVL